MSFTSELIIEQCSKAFDGYQYVFSHESYLLNCNMKFGIYIPCKADNQCLPLLIFLSDSNSTEQTFITKSGMQYLASKYNLIIANPDTVPRNCAIEDSGCYIDAIENQSNENYQMFSYINEEFYELIIENFNIDIERIGIFGHGMGGYGALISYFKCPGQYKSISAISPIYNPIEYPLIKNSFRKYLGENEEFWKKYDLIELVQISQCPILHSPILIDQNFNEKFHEKFLEACSNASFPIQIREQIDYDTNYYFLITFLHDHIQYHKNELININENNTFE